MWKRLFPIIAVLLFGLGLPQRAYAIGEIFIILADGTLVFCESGTHQTMVNLFGPNAGTQLGNVNNIGNAIRPPPPTTPPPPPTSPPTSGFTPARPLPRPPLNIPTSIRPGVGVGVGGGSAAGTAGVLAAAVAIAVVATVAITAAHDYDQTGNPWHTWNVIGDGFAAADNLQKLAPGSMGVTDTIKDDAINNFWGPGTPLKWWTKPPTSTLVSPGQPNYTRQAGQGSAWSFAACMCPSGGYWHMCIGYTIPRCADQTPYGEPLTSYFPDFVRGDGRCGPDPTSTAYRGLRKWCRQGGSWPTAEPSFQCTTMAGCN